MPLSRLELRFARLVPRRDTRVVLCDDGEGLVDRAAKVLADAGYTDVSYLKGGVAAWGTAGFELFSGVNVPSKAFGEHIEHACKTPSVSAEELDKLMRDGTDMVIVDSRPFDEFQRVSIPTATNVPGAELVLRIRDIAPSPGTLVVVNCAGRTRSIIGAQSLINAGLPNKVVALRNGTMGWSLAGLARDSGKTKRFAPPSTEGLTWAKAAAERVAKRHGVMRISPEALKSFQSDVTRTTYLFDVRDPVEYSAGHFPGAVSAPGGQLVQATDQYAGTLGARVVLVDDHEVRAAMTASWLRQMGWSDVFVLIATGRETGGTAAPVLGPAPPSERGIEARELSNLMAKEPCHRSRSLAQSGLPQGSHSGRLVRHPRAAFACAGENSGDWRTGADLGGWRSGRYRGLRNAGAGALFARRQRRLEGRRPRSRDRRPHGRRAARLLAQALRALRRHQERDERIPVMGGRSAAADRARRHDAVSDLALTFV